MMYRKIDNHKRTASYNAKAREIIVMCDDGWEDILDFRMSCASEAEAIEYFAAAGYEEYDPNAELKAAGFVWDKSRGIYAKP